jgi:hypothetical protein
LFSPDPPHHSRSSRSISVCQHLPRLGRGWSMAGLKQSITQAETGHSTRILFGGTTAAAIQLPTHFRPCAAAMRDPESGMAVSASLPPEPEILLSIPFTTFQDSSPRARHGAWLPCFDTIEGEKPDPVSSTGRRLRGWQLPTHIRHRAACTLTSTTDTARCQNLPLSVIPAKAGISSGEHCHLRP